MPELMSQYRCETCKYNDNGYCEVFDYRLYSSEIDTLAVFGCASHSESICQGKKVMNVFVSLITSEMVYDDGDMYYKVNPEKYVEVLGRMVSKDDD